MNINLFAILAFVAAFFPNPAHAYLDAGSASIVFQAIIAGLVGAVVTTKIYWKKLRVWVRKFFSGKPQK